MQRHCENAEKVAEYLSHNKIQKLSILQLVMEDKYIDEPKNICKKVLEH